MCCPRNRGRSRPSIDYSDLKTLCVSVHTALDPVCFNALQSKLGVVFDLDAFCKDSGTNRLCHHCCSTSRPFQTSRADAKAICMHPPYLKISQALRHFKRCKENKPALCAAILLQKCTDAPCQKQGLLDGWKLVNGFPQGSAPFVQAVTHKGQEAERESAHTG